MRRIKFHQDANINWGVLCVVTLTFLSLLSASTPPVMAQSPNGEEIYKKRCASCHDSGGARVPTRDTLRQMSAIRILRVMDFGLMMNVAYPLRRDEREAVANFLGTPGKEPGPPQSAFCSSAMKPLAGSDLSDWNGWSPDRANMRFQDAKRGGLDTAQVKKLKLKWAYGFAGDVASMGAVTVKRGTLFTGSANGGMQALDAKTGCIHWFYQSAGPVRSAPLIARDGARELVLYSDLIGWFYALDASTGKEIWKRKPEDHEATRLTGAPVELKGVVYVPAASWEESRAIDPSYPCCTFRGSITALNLRDGAVVWKTYMMQEPKRLGANKAGATQYGPSGAGIWSAPTLDLKRGLMYVTTGDNYSKPPTATSDAVVALNIKTGRIVWTTQTLPNDVYTSACGNKSANCPDDSGPDYDFGASAIMLKTVAGKEIAVAGQKSGMVFGLDLDNKGKILWQTRVGKGGTYGGVQWGMASDGEKVFAATSDGVRLQGGTSASAGPNGMATFDPAQGGGLTALKLSDGSKAWFAAPAPCDPPRPGCSPAQSMALTAVSGAVFSGSLDGHVRAFSSEDGKVIWDFDTVKEYTTVNGVPAKGGSLDGAGPVVADGMLFVNSGYPRFGGAPGNVLLAFGPED